MWEQVARHSHFLTRSLRYGKSCHLASGTYRHHFPRLKDGRGSDGSVHQNEKGSSLRGTHALMRQLCRAVHTQPFRSARTVARPAPQKRASFTMQLRNASPSSTHTAHICDEWSHCLDYSVCAEVHQRMHRGGARRQCILEDSETHNIDLGLGLGHQSYLRMVHRQVYKFAPIGIACCHQRKIHRMTRGTELGNKTTHAVGTLAFPELLLFTSSVSPPRPESVQDPEFSGLRQANW